MDKAVFTFLLLLPLSNASAATFPHESAIFKTITDGGILKHESETYITFSDTIEDSITAEWSRQETFGRVERSLNLTKNGTIYHVNLDTNQCTKTDIKAFTDKINDPEKLADQLKKSMNLQAAGSCEGSGLRGTKFSHSFGEMCLYKDVFMLWQSAMGTTTKVTDIQFDVRLPKNKTTLPSGLHCVPGPDLSRGLPGMTGQISPNSVPTQKQKARSQPDPPSQKDMDDAMKQVNDLLKKFGGMMDQ